MSENRLTDYLDHMQQAATDACGFDVVWDTVQTALPELLKHLSELERKYPG
ncbi:hypothetical protein [Ferrovum sp.]|jgi:hypothetical protein|uniref:hypothetical protein n=1 Tax=Ferrovum sp. TaxID=2609467 RepID=UPI0026350EB9|nr:hypothetical protein [Ferrovum sp.]